MNEVFSVALVGGLIGTFFGGFTKFLWETWLPDRLTWRRTRRAEREQQMSRYRAPAIRALAELRRRLSVIARTNAADHRYVTATGQAGYFVDSTAYLLARAFGWLEILRRQLSGYDYAQLYTRLEVLTQAFANGRPGFQVFALQQTEVGERMTTGTGAEPDCVAYSAFLDTMGRDDRPACLALLRERVGALLDDPIAEIDRLARIDRALADVLGFLDADGRWRSLVASEPIDVEAVTRAFGDGGRRERPAAGPRDLGAQDPHGSAEHR
jgi:hypothetical protein